MLIPNVVKVLCFDKLLQVLILNVVSWGRLGARLEAGLSSAAVVENRLEHGTH